MVHMIGIIRKDSVLEQIIKFCMVGSLGAVITYPIFFACFFPGIPLGYIFRNWVYRTLVT